ncbi:cytochrome P450 [Phanerochaete sordida]|uniref:Cytochrome P450 n=1 Tax=Phanerochaete sordida TaxID=48140 RepID=A0A9P3GB14_9APHY|nr:cytochrome P450 [Phanerochaete sordida]
MERLDLAIVLSLAGILAVYLLVKRSSYQGPFPPGPRQLPILGNVFDFDPSSPWTSLTRWKREYGSLVGIKVLGTRIVFLNSYEAMNDLLEKRGNIYSHRPIFTVLGELMTLNKSIMLIPYGPEWRECRRLEHLALGPAAVKDYQKVQERIAATLCQNIMDDPANFFDLVRLNSARVVLHIVYGISPRVIDKEYMSHAEETMRVVGQASVLGAFLCDFIPAMKYLPSWMPFQRKAQDGKAKIERMVTTPFTRVKNEMASGNASPSLLNHLLTSIGDGERDASTEERIMWTTCSMYAAGAESTAGTTLVFLIAMALNPAAQSRAQEEIDAVLGHSRLPQLSDKNDLPYVSALVKEVMRWHPMLPLSIARRTAADDTYQGYFIPKGTVVVPNVCEIAFSPNAKYPPADFIPERFLDSEVQTMDPALWAFGFGRRLCPGKLLGEANVWILIATLLSVFNIKPPADGSLDPHYESQLVSLPKRFNCRISPRSADKVAIVQEALV